MEPFPGSVDHVGAFEKKHNTLWRPCSEDIVSPGVSSLPVIQWFQSLKLGKAFRLRSIDDQSIRGEIWPIETLQSRQ